MNVLDGFHPIIQSWFRDKFGEPTEPQVRGWPAIRQGRNTLIAAPTGSGKTLAAFLACIDSFFRRAVQGKLQEETEVVYVSPLKALSNDIQRNLQAPLAEIQEQAISAGLLVPQIRTAVRTGDTDAKHRQAMLKRPPHILVTTPESLYLLLTSPRGREMLRPVKTVIVDEIHALARDKRGSHLSLTLERLNALCETPPVRIGLSATQRPIEEIAQFLVGSPPAAESLQLPPACEIIDVGHLRQLDLALNVPPSELNAVCSHEQWEEVYARLVEQIQSHRSTLVFVNTRRLAERVAHRLTELLGEEAVASHHGSLSRAIRQSAEERLKNGQLKAIVATASLEMGIDIGYIDLVCQIGSPRSISTFLQRVGRAGHCLGAIPKGRLFPLTRDELLECLAVVRAVRKGRLDRIEIPVAPLDILAQQIVAETACQDWDEEALFHAVRRAYPYRDLSRESYTDVVKILSQGISPSMKRGAYLHRDAIGGQLKARRGARLAAITCGGAIPDMADYRVVTEEDRTFVGTVNEDFAIDSSAGDIFLLGTNSWRIRYVRGLEVVVSDAHGAPATVPFWFGEAPGRTVELSEDVSELRQEIEHLLTGTPTTEQPAGKVVELVPREALSVAAGTHSEKVCLAASSDGEPVQMDYYQATDFDGDDVWTPPEEAVKWLQKECGAEDWAAAQALRYCAAQYAALGLVPTAEKIVFERFFDESGGMQLVIHAPLGARINKAWGLALRKRFCRSFDFELQAAADDDGVVLSLGPQHSFPLDQLFKMLNPQNAKYLLEQALLAVPLFQTRWRWNVTRSLAVLRFNGGKKVPPNLQRFRSEDLLAAVFPQTVGCLENHHGDVEIPAHPLVQQTMHDCLHEALDLNGWIGLLQRVMDGHVQFLPRDTREPSPFCHELLNANPYAFLDDAPLEERRARAVAVRRSLSVEAFRDLCKLEPAAIEQVKREAWPTPRDVDEMHDTLLTMGALPAVESNEWSDLLMQLVQRGRATKVRRLAGPALWIAAEHWPLAQAAFPDAEAVPPVKLPTELQQPVDASAAWVTLLRGRMPCVGPVRAERLAADLGLQTSQVNAALEALEAEGSVLRGHFTVSPSASKDTPPQEWCDRRLLARIHRLTLQGLRRQIEPVEPEVFLHFLCRHHRLTGPAHWRGEAGVKDVIGMLQGFEMPAGAWEERVLAARVEDYDARWLDQAALTGQIVWGRLRPPQRDEEDGPSSAGMTRTVPISLALREDLAWLLPAQRTSAEAFARSNAQQVLQALTTRGALFQSDLAALTKQLPTHLEEALQELSALGLITADTFAAVRALAGMSRQLPSRRSVRSGVRRPLATGRWSLFPGVVEEVKSSDQVERWAKLLLRRYGVLFRDLLTRETAAPAWGKLAPVLRRLELRGDVRGGRFVKGVAGEQFATPEAVDRLRQCRDETPSDQWVVLSAADPLNLLGIITPGPRLPATHRNTFILRHGQLLATYQAGQVEFHHDLPLPLTHALTRALQLGRSAPSTATVRHTLQKPLFHGEATA